MRHHLVDGMNVIGSRPDGWWRDRTGAMARLVAAVDRWCARTGAPATVVLDGHPRDVGASVLCDVAFAPGGRDAADDEIARRVRSAADPSVLLVVTSDRGLEVRVRETGAEVTGASGFRDALEADDVRPATSARDPRVTLAARLLRGPQRPGSGGARLVAIDGEDVVREALGLGADVALVLASEAVREEGVPFGSAPVVPASGDALRALGALGQPAEVVALARVAATTAPTEPPPPGALVLRGVRDEGNVGTIIRTAVALGLPAVLLDERCADPFARRALRAAAGATFAPGVVRAGVDVDALLRAPAGERPPLVAAVARGGGSPDAMPEGACVVLGGERDGLSDEDSAACDGRVTIPCPGFESLNVAAAAAILGDRLRG